MIAIAGKQRGRAEAAWNFQVGSYSNRQEEIFFEEEKGEEEKDFEMMRWSGKTKFKKTATILRPIGELPSLTLESCDRLHVANR